MNVSSVPNLWSVSILWAVGVCSLQRFVCLHIVSCICHHNYHEHIQAVSCVSPGCELYVSSCARVIHNEVGTSHQYLLCRFFLFWASPRCELSYECLQCPQSMICLTILWAVSVWMLCAMEVSILWESPYCESLHIVSVSILWPVHVSILRMSPGCKMCASPGHKCALRGCGIAHVPRLWTLSVSILWPVCVSTFRTLGWALCVFKVYISRWWQWNWSSQPDMFVLYVISAANSNFLHQLGWPIPISWIYLIIRFGYIPLSAEECRIFRYFTIKKVTPRLLEGGIDEVRFLKNQSCNFENSYV